MRTLPLLVSLAVACSSPPKKDPAPRQPPQKRAGSVTLSIIGTNDLHGALERLPILAGYLVNLRAARAADGGGVVLLDGGDMFQGTLESNLSEGADVVRAYNEMGYTATAVGNHEFDFGPEGPATTPQSIEDDARGALLSRAREAKFPMLVANISDKTSGARIKWPNMPPSVLVEVAGIKVGIIGASTESTPFTTMPANFVGLVMAPPTAVAIAAESTKLRAEGAAIVIVTAHIGSKCADFEKPTDTSSCEKHEELNKLINDLPKGSVDAIVAGHTHAGIAHRINDIAVIESFSSGRAFGRIDIRIAADGRVTAVSIDKPRAVCAGETATNPVMVADCKPGDYEGKPVVPEPGVQKIVDEALARAKVRRDEKLGVTLTGKVEKSYGSESAEGNWFTDLMLAAHPGAHVALTNGGGLRADMPAGDLTYGRLYEAMPFDNRFALVDVKGSHLRSLVSTNLQRGGGILSWGGLTAKGRCKGGKLDLEVWVGGKPLDEARAYKLVTSDFLASGGDGLLGRLKLPAGAIKITDVIIRDSIADILRKKKGQVDPAKLFSPTSRRLDFEGQRPISCAAKSPTKPTDQEPPE
ncbi:MAG: 5'-nucleotidase C-terminal domain-containing protein [Deltaproteobacteria bacterium]|nr:5'-nucleotidase C-terminal domain-containing protein [Deltaproteobacteria bacterium]